MNKDIRQDRRWIMIAAIGMLLFGMPLIFKGGFIYALTEVLGIGIFLYLTQTLTSRKELAAAGVMLMIAHILRYHGIAGDAVLDIVLMSVFGGLVYLTMLVSSYFSGKVNGFFSTLIFPVCWQCMSFFFVTIRFPIMMRMDMMFYDFRPFVQSEAIIMGYGLNAFLIWMIALVVYSIQKKEKSGVITAVGITVVLTVIGQISIWFAPVPEAYLRTAYATGPYMGTFLDYYDVDLENDLESLRTSAAAADTDGAKILIFNEEAFTIADHEEEDFLTVVKETAQAYHLHILVGMEVMDTDQSRDGKAINKLIWMDPQGNILGEYTKYNTIPILESSYVRGNGEIPILDLTIDGEQHRIAFAICYDSTFQYYLKQIRGKADFLFLPSWDWDGISDIHYRVCGTDAISERVTVLKPTYDGYSIAADPFGRVLKLTNTKETGYEQVVTVDLPKYPENVPAEPVTMEDGQTASNWKYAIMGAEVFCIFFLLIIWCVNYFEARYNSKRRSSFGLLLIADMVAMLADLISWSVDGIPAFSTVNFAATAISIVLTFVIAGLFIEYIYNYLDEKETISKRAFNVGIVCCIFECGMTFFGCLSGAIFSIQNGLYVEGPLYIFYMAASALSLVAIFLIICVNAKKLGKRDMLVAFAYIYIPLIEIIINAFLPECGMFYPATSLALMILFILLQSDHVSELIKSRQEIHYAATHDKLTGLLNRQAYYEINDAREKERTMGVLFCDANALKYSNDKFGHEAGDQLLYRIAELLREVFDTGEIYRISGDEFVVLMPEAEETSFSKLVQVLKARLEKEEFPLASVGACYGVQQNLEMLVERAEKDMYEDKQRFYKKYPQYHR